MMELTRRSFFTGAAAGVAAASLGAAASVAFADEAGENDEVAEILYERTTLHAGYDTDREITDEQIQLLMEAAMSAPTGGNQCAIDFFPVTDPEVRAGIRAAHNNFGACESAPLIVVITTNHDAEHFPELLEMDAGIAAMAIVVQATQMGMSTCCMSISPQYDRMSGVGAALNLPTDTNSPVYDPIIMVAIGYPAADTEAGASVDGYDPSRVHLNGFAAE